MKNKMRTGLILVMAVMLAVMSCGCSRKKDDSTKLTETTSVTEESTGETHESTTATSANSADSTAATSSSVAEEEASEGEEEPEDPEVTGMQVEEEIEIEIEEGAETAGF